MISAIVCFVFLATPLAENTAYMPLDHAIEEALKREISFKKAQSQILVSDLELNLAKKNRLPSVGFSGNARYQSENMQVEIPGMSGMTPTAPAIEGPHFNVDLNLGVRYPLLSGGRLNGGLDLGRLSIESSTQQLKLTRSQLAWNVKQIYFNDRLLEAQKNSLNSLKKSLEIHLSRLKGLFSAGLSSTADLIEGEEKIIEIDLSIMEIDRARLLLSDRFLELTGLELQYIEPDHRELIPKRSELEEIIENHPVLELHRIGEKQTLVQEKVSTADYRPQVSLFAELHGGTPGVNMLSDDWAVYGIVGLSLRMTLFDFNKRKELQTISLLQREQLRFERNRQQEQFLARVEALYNQIDSLKRQEQSSLRIVELAERFLAHQERLWRENQASHTDYLTALEHLSQQQSRLDQIHWQIERLKGEIHFNLASVKENKQ